MTPIETLIEKLEKIEANLDKSDTTEFSYGLGISKAISEAHSLLPQEREAIEEAYYDAYMVGQSDSYIPIAKDTASDYFTKKYGK